MTASDDGQTKGSSVDADGGAAFRRVVCEFPTTCLMLARPDGSIVAEWMGEDIARMSGYEVEELEADPELWLNIVHPADREKVRRAWRRLASGKHTHTEYRIFRKDGQMRWIADTGSAAEDTSQGLIRCIRCAADITAAKAGKEWSIDFQELVDETPVAVVVRDLTGRMIYCNVATSQLFSYASVQDLLDTTFEDVMTPESSAEFRERIFPMVLESPWSGELTIERKDGGSVEVKVSTNLLRDDQLRPVAVYAVLTDITQLKQTEQALRTSEDVLKAVQDSLAANLAVIDSEGTIIAVNERWRQFARENGDPDLAHTCEGVNYLDICRRAKGPWSEGAEAVLEGLKAVLRGESSEFEAEYPCPSPAHARWFFVRASRLAGAQGGAVIAHIDITERKWTEEALRTSEELVHRRYDAVSAGMIVFDREGKIIYANTTACQILGRTMDEIIGATSEDPTWRLIREDGTPFPQDEVPSAVTLRTQQPTHGTVLGTFCAEPAGCRWLMVNSEPVLNPSSGEMIEVLVTFVDITESKHVQEALRESEEKYRSIAENLDAVVFRIDRNMLPIAIAGHIEEVLGYAPKELERHPSLFREILHPDDLNLIWGLLERTAALGCPQPFDVRMRHRTGETKWLRGTLTPVFDAAGRLAHYDGVSLDVTRLRSAEEARRQSEDRLRSVIDTADALIFRVDSENRPIALYGRAAEISGYSIPELLESPNLWRTCIYPEDRERVRKSYEEIAATGERRAIELQIVNKSGLTRWVRTQVTPRYDSGGNLLYFDGVGLDITERVEAQEREAKRVARMTILTEVSQQFASSLDFQCILDTATRRLCETLGSVSVGITIEPSSGHLSHLSICCPGDCEIENMDRAIKRSGLTVEDVLGSGGVMSRIVPDLHQMSSIAATLVDAACLSDARRLGPAVVAPVSAGADAVGALFSARVVGREFDQEDLWFVSEMASHASAALANAALYRRQAKIAEALQRSLIPAAPSIRCLDIATVYAPSPGDAQVGGDFLDVFYSDCRHVGVVVGDVSGKGVAAAIHTAEAKYMLRAIAHADPDPGRVVDSLNKALCDYLPDETFVTLLYCLINAVEHTMTCASAGHEVSFVLSHDRKIIREIAPTGPALGVTQSAVYTVRQETFEPGDMLFCYTDGITDVRTNGHRFGFERLRETVLSAPKGDAKSLMEHVMETVRSFGQSKQTDDQVVMVIRPLI